MTRAIRTNPDIRRGYILQAAIKLAKEMGYQNITRDAVAYEADISSSLIANYYPRMIDLKNAVLEAAMDSEIPEIVAQGLAISDPIAMNMNDELKIKVFAYLASK